MMGRFHPVGTMGLPYFKSRVDSSHAFSQIYGVKAMVLVKIMIPSARLALARKVADT